MKRLRFIIIILFIIVLTLSSETYARYVLNRQFNVSINTAPFYFEASQISDVITFKRTSNESDFDEILTTETTFNLLIKNNDNKNFNSADTTYQVSVISNPKFTFKEGDTVTKTINGGSLINDTITLNLKIKEMTSTLSTVTIRVTSTEPYSKSYEFTFKVVQEGAIQYIEDLVDMSLGIRNKDNPNNLQTADIQSKRFKMTRDLDFTNQEHYKNPSSEAYGDINGNDIKGNIYTELTSDTGFLPIGELSHTFKGGFNGGGHTLSNLTIQKSLQINIGFFGTTEGATIKDLNFAAGNVINHNQTAGMLVGKVIGGKIENITVQKGSVVSMDEDKMTEDTYTGGIAGYVTASAQIINCTNYATVRTKFVGNASEVSGPAGGITAWMAHSTIDGCVNYGEIIGESYIGGIAGFSGMQLDNDTVQKLGGGTIQNCKNYGYIHYDKEGAVDSNWGKHIGGIAGYNKKAATITACRNESTAKVEGLTNVGGLVGNNAGTVSNSHNYSSYIKGTSSVKNLIGNNTGTSTNNQDHAS